LGRYIKRLEIKLRGKFKDTGINATRCARAEVIFNVDLEDMAEGFRNFIDAFNDVQRCRSHCRVDDFLLNRHGEQVHSYVNDAAPLSKNQANRGFKNIAKNLDDILQEGATACTCKICSLRSPTTSSYGERVGDAIIALETLGDMRLEHTDNSFNHLCPSLGLNHKQHPSELKIVQSSSGQ